MVNEMLIKELAFRWVANEVRALCVMPEFFNVDSTLLADYPELKGDLPGLLAKLELLQREHTAR